MYATEKENPKNPNYPFRNIYKPREEETDALITKAEVDDIIDGADNSGGKSVIADENNTSERIRWMNSLNNACRLVQGQVITVDEVNPMKSIVQLANVFYKLEPQR